MTTRRRFLSLLSSLPFLGWLRPVGEEIDWNAFTGSTERLKCEPCDLDNWPVEFTRAEVVKAGNYCA